MKKVARIRVVQVGLGPLGQRIVKMALQRDGIRIVAAVDTDEAKIGRDVGLLSGAPRLGVRVERSLASALRGRGADVAVLATVSELRALEPQVAALARAGLPVVSTCEELSYPWRTAPAVSRRIDAVCKKHGVACVGTGVNPGFLMDFLPAVLSSVCGRVDKVTVRRFQDASVRRVPFQEKIGAGLTPAEFRARVAAGKLRHVGLTESMHMMAAALGWKLTRTTESLRAIRAVRAIASGYKPIEKGMACGVEQVGRGYLGPREAIRLHFRAAVGEPASFDEVEIEGLPGLKSRVEGGVNGDLATCAVVLNALHAVADASPGLHTMIDLPLPSCR